MAKPISPVRKRLMKQSILESPSKPMSYHYKQAGYSDAVAYHHANRMSVYKRVMEEIEAEWKMKDVTVENVLKEIDSLKVLATNKEDYATAGRMTELKGRYLAMFTDKQRVDQVNINIEDQSLISKYMNSPSVNNNPPDDNKSATGCT